MSNKKDLMAALKDGKLYDTIQSGGAMSPNGLSIDMSTPFLTAAGGSITIANHAAVTNITAMSNVVQHLGYLTTRANTAMAGILSLQQSIIYYGLPNLMITGGFSNDLNTQLSAYGITKFNTNNLGFSNDVMTIVNQQGYLTIDTLPASYITTAELNSYLGNYGIHPSSSSFSNEVMAIVGQQGYISSDAPAEVTKSSLITYGLTSYGSGSTGFINDLINALTYIGTMDGLRGNLKGLIQGILTDIFNTDNKNRIPLTSHAWPSQPPGVTTPYDRSTGYEPGASDIPAPRLLTTDDLVGFSGSFAHADIETILNNSGIPLAQFKHLPDPSVLGTGQGGGRRRSNSHSTRSKK